MEVKIDQKIETGRHSLSHVLAYAVKQLFDDVKFGIGPAIDNGFYYDFDLPKVITEEDFEAITKKMQEIIKSKAAFEKKVISKSDALKLFADQPYKKELISELEGEISIYTIGDFTDLCKGPHVENTTHLMGWDFRIHSVAGAYWRGNNDNKVLQRIYVYAYESKKELKEYLNLLEEAKRRDHRVLGPQQDLFFIDDSAPGMPYWLPKGWKLFNTLLDFWRVEHEGRGYTEISSPLINNSQLWKTSGHWAHYQHNMFLIPLSEDNVMAAKPMNCPNAMKVYQRKVRSYRELPMRLSDCDVLHRSEISGTLHGLFRVQMFRQDDAHIFLKEDQIFDEINNILDIADLFYQIFGLTYRPVLSTRPADFMGEIEKWNEAEANLKTVLDARYGMQGYDINEGDGAFYGPKIDIMMQDALKRVWQTGTIQLDFQLPLNFDLKYSDSDGTRKTPVVIHRVVYGSFERFIGILIEHFTGKFPYWLCPVQVAVVPVTAANNAYAKKVMATLAKSGIRCEADYEDSSMGGKVNKYRLERVPYVLILGDKEQADKVVSVKSRSGQQHNMIALKDFVKVCKSLNDNKTLELAEEF